VDFLIRAASTFYRVLAICRREANRSLKNSNFSPTIYVFSFLRFCRETLLTLHQMN